MSMLWSGYVATPKQGIMTLDAQILNKCIAVMVVVIYFSTNNKKYRNSRYINIFKKNNFSS